jgi:hypothetical protein
MAANKPRVEQVLILDEALTRLAEWSPRQARVVEIMFFGGLTCCAQPWMLIQDLA